MTDYPKFQETMDQTQMETLKTKVTFLGKGWGIRLLNLDGSVKAQDFVTEKVEIGPALKELLRWESKLGSSSPMADASRERMLKKGRSA